MSRDLVDSASIVSVRPIIIEGIIPNAEAIIRQKTTFTLSFKDFNGDYKTLDFEAYISDQLPKRTLLIGLDYFPLFVREDSRVFRSILGDYDFHTRTHIRKINTFNLDDDEPIEVSESPISLDIKRLSSGQYSARLPFFSTERPRDNFFKALNHVIRLRQRLIKNGLLDAYEKQLLTHQEEGHAESILSRTGFFIPHREVIRPDAESTNFRLVFNASFGGIHSLNYNLHKGEPFSLDITGHHIRLRQYRFLATLDLQKAFLQISIPEPYRVYLRFLWIDKEGRIQCFQMTVLPFGVITSPAILVAVVQAIISALPEDTREIFENCYYMDDLIVGAQDEFPLSSAILTARQAFADAGFRMHKVHTNSDVIAEAFEVERSSCNLLGLQWNTVEDSIPL